MDALSLESIKEIENALGYTFQNTQLLIESLTHKTKHHEDSYSFPFYYERLEFLGDSVLSLIIAETLFLNNSKFNEAQMSQMKSYLVKETVLFEIAKGINLGKYLFLGKGEETSGGRQKKSILADVIEALIGAIYLDSGYDNTRSLVLKLFSHKIQNVIEKKEGTDFKSELQEFCQNIYGTTPEYKIVRQQGEEHKKIFTVEVYINGNLLGSGIGKSKKEAETFSAKEALSKLATSDCQKDLSKKI
ncbi:MAG: ribonuclease III [Thermodesulfovibrionales bacterium]|nr:ribonuclease III [Thermodesulfovibrionales bacterium]